MRSRHCVCVLLAAAHLVVVICGAGDWLPDRSGGPPAWLVEWYATMSGAGSGYGFFAPAVGARYRARFVLRDVRGSTWTDTFDQSNSPEARLRLAGSADRAFASGEAEQSAARRERLVKSWAAVMFSRHPGAASLTVIVEAYDVPTMAQYRSGQRPSWQVEYEAHVQRDSSAVAAGL